jgi:hypothetical protein
MAGGLMQLVAYGAQDVYLTGNPKVTFFQAVYKRHTNFAMENIEQTVNGSAGNSGRLSVTVARNGDLIGDMYIELLTSAVNARAGSQVLSGCWAAERAIKDIELSIGGQRIDKQYQLWWRLYSELNMDESKKATYAKMTSNATGAAGTVYLPLLFFFNRNAGLYLPLIALQYHEVRLDFDLSADFAAYTDNSTFKVWGNYVYLDTEERRRFAQKGHEYLIEQVQHTGSDTVIAGSAKQVRLSYNHPVKELVWCFNDGTVSNAAVWNFTSNAQTSNSVVLSCNPVTAATTANALCLSSTTCGTGVPQYVTGNVDVALQGANSNSHCRWSEDGAPAADASVGPLDTFKLILNGQDRFKEQKGKYFNQVQPFNHHSGCPYPGVYSYSFALKPEEHQPTGTCNFSRIDNAQVQVTLKGATSGATYTGDCTTLNMFATNYNVLRIQSGMGGLAFSN